MLVLLFTVKLTAKSGQETKNLIARFSNNGEAKMKKVSEIIAERLQKHGKTFRCNENISGFISDHEYELLIREVQEKVQGVLSSLVIDTENDHNTRETAKRVAKMFCREIFAGRFQPKPDITAFPNHLDYDQLYISGPITVRSMCAHHWMPIVGKAYVGVFPGGKVIGLSKFNRLVDWVASRPQIQEEMTVQIADEIERETEAAGVAVVIRAEHMCMTHRGVREHESDMSTSVMRGKFREDPNLKNEFLQLIAQMK